MKIFILIAVTLFSVLSHAHENHTAQYCDAQMPDFCVHLGYDKAPEVGVAFDFMTHLMAPAEQLEKVQSVLVELVMLEMGHGSVPLKVEKVSLDHYHVSEAYFVMAGTWTVQVTVVTSERHLFFQIPFDLK